MTAGLLQFGAGQQFPAQHDGRQHYWKLMFWSLGREPRLFPLAITYAVYGYHFRKVTEQIMESGRHSDRCGKHQADSNNLGGSHG